MRATSTRALPECFPPSQLISAVPGSFSNLLLLPRSQNSSERRNATLGCIELTCRRKNVANHHCQPKIAFLCRNEISRDLATI